MHYNFSKLQHAVALAVHTIFRPLGGEIQPRKDPLSEKKLQREGAPNEQKTVLDWDVNTRHFRVHLPVYKNIAWSKDITRVITTKTTNYDNIKTILGRLTYAATLFFPARLFLDRIRNLERRCIKYGEQQVSSEEQKDLLLWLNFLDHITIVGISINNITFTTFDAICWSYASEHGLGGYTSSGLAFSYEIPHEYQGLLHINLLEFIAAHWTIYMAIHHSAQQHCRVSHMANNTSALAWLRKTSFHTQKQQAHTEAARIFAVTMMEKEATLASTHKAGKANVVADALSRDTHLNTSQLTNMIMTLSPKQAPKITQICRPDRVNQLGILLAQAALSQKRGHGAATCETLESMIHGWIKSANKNEISSSAVLQKLYDEISMAHETLADSELKQLVPSLEAYVRPFGRTFWATLA